MLRFRFKPVALIGLLTALAAPLHAAGDTLPIPLQPPCLTTAKVFPGTTLTGLANRYYADPDFRFAILLATNARTGPKSPFAYVPDLFQLIPGNTLCIPQLPEAERLRNRYLRYDRAVHDMALPVPSEITDNLNPLEPGEPVRVATWVRQSGADWYQGQIGKQITTSGEIWVTEEPHLQEFCAAFVEDRGPDPAGLRLRLEQRLGLPPNAAKVAFVSLELTPDATNSNIFRPCTSPDVTTNTCALGPIKTCTAPGADASAEEQAAFARCHAHRDFFLGQYYNSFGVSHPTEYPWTSLGYTFDWASGPLQGDGSTNFVRYGQSEYVIAAGTSVKVAAVTPTDAYCTPKK